MENINLTNELIFKYQMDETDVADTLAEDLAFLQKHPQVSAYQLASVANTIQKKYYS